MSNPHLKCPYCDTEPVSNFWFKHILAKHMDKLFDPDTAEGKFNRSALNFTADRKCLPQLRFKGDKKFCCFKCRTAVERECYADKHLKCLRESKAKVESLFSEINSETPPSGSSEAVSSQEVAAYKSVIIKLLDELDTQMWIAERWNAAREIPEIDRLITEYGVEVEEPKYDLATEMKREAKLINLDRDHLNTFRNFKF